MNNRNINTNASHDFRSASIKNKCCEDVGGKQWTSTSNITLGSCRVIWILASSKSSSSSLSIFLARTVSVLLIFHLICRANEYIFCRISKCPRGPMERWYADLFTCELWHVSSSSLPAKRRTCRYLSRSCLMGNTFQSVCLPGKWHAELQIPAPKEGYNKSTTFLRWNTPCSSFNIRILQKLIFHIIR